MRREQIEDDALIFAIRRAERGLVQADLGGSLIKERVAHPNKGRSGGYRTVSAYRRGDLAVFLFGFAKKERANIDNHQLAALKELGNAYLAADVNQIAALVANGDLREVPYE